MPEITAMRLLFLLSVLLLAGCGGGPKLPPLPDDAIILAFGDSLTYGTGAGRGEDYPSVLTTLTGHRVVNAGVPGEESTAGLARLPAVLESAQPQLVFLGHGGNDLLRHRDLAQTRDNLRRMVELVRARGASAVLLGVPKPGLFLSTHPLYRELAAELDVPLEDEALADILGDRELKSDEIHPNAAGYRRLAEALDQLLQNSGALEGR
jgi:lysophospholipase L1-like esterase